MGDFHATSMCRFMVATQAALWPLATAPAATRHRRMHRDTLERFMSVNQGRNLLNENDVRKVE